MDRRKVILAAAASIPAAIPQLVNSQNATPEPRSGNVLVRYIDEVLVEGNTDVIPELVTADISMPQQEIEGIEDFTWRAVANFANRQKDYESYEYEIVSVIENEEWIATIAHTTWVVDAGAESSEVLGWIAELKGGLISILYSFDSPMP